jgi:hypothetical protein
MENSFGYEWSQENRRLFDMIQLVARNKKLFKINIALLRILAIKAFIKKNSDGLAAGLATLKKVAARNIQKVPCEKEY